MGEEEDSKDAKDDDHALSYLLFALEVIWRMPWEQLEVKGVLWDVTISAGNRESVYSAEQICTIQASSHWGNDPPIWISEDPTIWHN